MKEVVFLNDKFLRPSEAKLSVLEPGFLYGWGLFETMRAYNHRIVYFNQHLQRIKNSSKLIKIQFPYSIDKLKGLIIKAVKLSGKRDTYVRLTLWKSRKGTETLIIAQKYQPHTLKNYMQGFRACIYSFRQNEDSFFSKIKTTSYLFYRVAYLEAKNRGFDEAIILNNRGLITEGSRSNIFFIKDNQIFTPALECGCLDGITRKVIFDLTKKYNLKIEQGKFSLLDLHRADEAFLTNSLIGVMSLVSIEKQLIGKGLTGRITKFFMQKYSLLLKNGT